MGCSVSTAGDIDDLLSDEQDFQMKTKQEQHDGKEVFMMLQTIIDKNPTSFQNNEQDFKDYYFAIVRKQNKQDEMNYMAICLTHFVKQCNISKVDSVRWKGINNKIHLTVYAK